MSAHGAVLDRSHLVVPRGRSRTARALPTGRASRRGRACALLVALTLGAGVAVWLLLAAFPGAAGGGAPAPAAPASEEIVGPATVVASASCTAANPQDTIAVDGPGGRRLLPLDACGSIVGATVTVRMTLDDAGPPVPARVLGTGGSGALVPNGETATSPLTGRLAILLTGVAGLAMAALLVAVARDRSRRSVSVDAPLTPSVTKAPRSPATRSAERRVTAGRAERASGARTASRPGRSPSSAACRTTSGTRRASSRPGSRRPAARRRRH